MERIQFGAPSSAGSTDSDGVPAMLEKTSDNKLPEPKEQRQKQPRAGPIKPQKVCIIYSCIIDTLPLPRVGVKYVKRSNWYA